MKSRSSTGSKRVWLIAGILTVLLLAGLGILINWISYVRPPLPEALTALESNDQVSVTTEPWLAFMPAEIPPSSGLILYPGGRIDARGYAPLARAIAAEGYLVVVPSMTLNIAAMSPNRADEIVAAYPDLEHWVIGGHSVGGTMAAQYALENPDQIDGLAVWASYPADSVDLAERDLAVTVIYGTLDPSASPTKVQARRHLFPHDTLFVPIEGGDHHQFGSYVTLPKNDLAIIPRAEQHAQIIQATLSVLQVANERGQSQPQ